MNQPAPTPTQPTLLFIPDISGFTQFVNDTEITHSQHIIEELLEILIDANEIGLSVSEIEGDAILFYLEGRAPTAAELLAQVQRMYVRFHAHLKRYESYRICQCGACCAASGLSLKFIAHYGDVGKNRIKEHSKLFGKDVIVAHRLLKNAVPHQEYVLITHQLVNACSTWVQIEQAAWAGPEQGEGTYDFGEIDYCYITLDPLKAHVPQPTVEDFSLPGAKTKLLACEVVVEAPIDLVFDVVSDLTFRHHWIVGLRDNDKFNTKIPQHGSAHRCVFKGTESDPFLISHDFQTGKDFITFTETDRRNGVCSVYTLRRIGGALTRIEIHLFMKRNVVKKLLFDLFMKKKFAREYEETGANLNAYCKQLLQEGKQHPAQVVLKLSAIAA